MRTMFEYTTKLEGYTNISSDIPGLSEMADKRRR